MLTASSCTFFEVKKINPETLLERELSGLRKRGIGEYPLFESCRGQEQKALQKRCFQQELTSHIATYLVQEAFYVEHNVVDTLWIPLLIDRSGTVHVEDFEIPDFIADHEPPLLTLLEESIQTLSELQPAHIRGIAVATRYRLPLVFRVEE